MELLGISKTMHAKHGSYASKQGMEDCQLVSSVDLTAASPLFSQSGK